MFKKLKSILDPGTLELLKHGKNYVSASVLVKGLSIISIPIMTRILTPADYGIISVFNSLSIVLGIIFSLGVGGAVSRFYFEDNNEFGSFLTTNVIFVGIVGILIGSTIYLERNCLSLLLNISPVLIKFGIVIGFFTGFFQIINSYLQASKQSVLVSRISIIRTILALIVTVGLTLYLNENKYLGSIYSQLIFSFIFFLFSIYIVLKIGSLILDLKYLKYSLLFGLPIVVHLLSGYILNNFDQIMINKIVGAAETGLYSFAYKIAMIFQLLISGLTQAWTPILFQKLKDKEYESLEIIANKFSFIIAIAALAIVIISPFLVGILVPESYSDAFSLIPIIIVGFLFQFFYTMYIGYAFFEKKTYLIAVITLIAGIVNIILNYYLIPVYGYKAAAWTTLISYFLFFIFHYFSVRFIIKPERIFKLKTIVLPGLFSIVLIIIYLFVFSILKDVF